MWIATLSTANFDFIAAGRARVDALNTIRRAWQTHREQTGATATYDDISDSVHVYDLKHGRAFRDGALFIDEV